MKLPFDRNVASAFAFALLCIVVVGTLQYRTVLRLDENSHWVSHTHEVLQELESVHNLMDRAAAAAQSFVVNGQQSDLTSYEQNAQGLRGAIQNLRTLTTDNTEQQAKLDQFGALLDQVLGDLQKKTQLRQAGAPPPELLLPLEASSQQNTRTAHEIIGQMQSTEFDLLRQRNEAVSAATRQTDWLIVLGCMVSFGLLAAATFTLLADISRRRQSEANIRALSGRLLRVQEDERRLVARDLHDSLGQYLAALAMELHAVRGGGDIGENADQKIAACIHLADQSLAEVRVATHLLYPPLLDELGLTAVARSYVEGFSQRSKIRTTFDIPPEFGRLPRDIEVAFFRILQESLTNIHRHSGSTTAHVRFFVQDGFTGLEVRDDGKGIPPARLDELRREAPGKLGVGLRGMIERMRQFGGKLDVSSDGHGTTLLVAVPSTSAAPDDEVIHSASF